MNFSHKNFLSPTPKKIKRISWAIKAFLGPIGAAEIVTGHQWAGLIVLGIGGLCDAVLEFFKEE